MTVGFRMSVTVRVTVPVTSAAIFRIRVQFRVTVKESTEEEEG